MKVLKVKAFLESRSFLDLGPRLCTYKISNWMFSSPELKAYGIPVEPSSVCVSVNIFKH